MKIKIMGFILLISSSMWVFATETGAWELQKQQDGIKIYTRDVAGSKYKEFKGEVILKTSLSNLLSLLENVKICHEWQYKCQQKIKLNDQYAFRINDLPWPVSDRYVITHSLSQYDEKTQTHYVQITNIKKNQLPENIVNKLPDTGSMVEMDKYQGGWKLIEQKEGEIKIIIQIHGEPGGSIPSAIVNAGVVNGPFETLMNMKERMER